MAPKTTIPIAQSFRQKFAFATAFVDARQLIPHSKVRTPEEHAINKVAGWIRRDGWIPTSILYVQEVDPDVDVGQPTRLERPTWTLESLIKSYKSLEPKDFVAQCPEGVSVRPHAKFNYLTEIVEDSYAARWFNVIDGAHRALAAIRVADEWRAEGKTAAADDLMRLPVIVMSKDMQEHTMVQFASVLNHSNENFVVTSNLHQMTALKRSWELWMKFVVQPKIAEIRRAEDQADTPPRRSDVKGPRSGPG